MFNELIDFVFEMDHLMLDVFDKGTICFEFDTAWNLCENLHAICFYLMEPNGKFLSKEVLRVLMTILSLVKFFQ